MIDQRNINLLNSRTFSLLLLLFTFSCTNGPELTRENVLNLEYAFNDASVPPEYHRSYTISVDIQKQTAKVVVDAYGEILKEASTEINDHQVNHLFDVMRDVNINCEIEEPEPCSGGTSESVIIRTKEASYDLFLDHCGEKEYPDDCGDIYGLKEYMKSLFPTLDELLE